MLSSFLCIFSVGNFIANCNAVRETHAAEFFDSEFLRKMYAEQISLSPRVTDLWRVYGTIFVAKIYPLHCHASTIIAQKLPSFRSNLARFSFPSTIDSYFFFFLRFQPDKHLLPIDIILAFYIVIIFFLAIHEPKKGYTSLRKHSLFLL